MQKKEKHMKKKEQRQEANGMVQLIEQELRCRSTLYPSTPVVFAAFPLLALFSLSLSLSFSKIIINTQKYY